MRRCYIVATAIILIATACAPAPKAAPTATPTRPVTKQVAQEQPTGVPKEPGKFQTIPTSTPPSAPTQTPPTAPLASPTPIPQTAPSTPPRPAPTATPATSPPAQVPDFAILPFNYRVNDTRDGWKVGTVDFAFLNATESALAAQELHLNVNGHQVQTLERKNYEANLFFSSEAPGSSLRGGSILNALNIGRQALFPVVVGRAGPPIIGSSPRLDPAGLPLPPKLPVTMVRNISKREIAGDGMIYDTLGLSRNGYFAQFRFAGGASPTRLMISGPTTSFSIDLLAPGADSPELRPVGLRQRSLLDLSTDIKQVNPNANLDFGQCRRGPSSSDDYALQYRLANGNKLDEVSLRLSHGVWYRNGEYVMSNWREAGPFLKAGPGQTVQAGLRLKNFGDPAYLVIYYGENEAKAYSLDCK